MIDIVNSSLGLLPVIFFLAGLMFLDSFQLVRLRSILYTIFVGAFVAIVCMYLNSWVMEFFQIPKLEFSKFLAPIVEETLKSIFLIYLIKSDKVGFLVDSAVRGFAIGTGFALFENIFYWFTLENSSIYVWIIRGFGTAALHGGTLVIFAGISKLLTEQKENKKLLLFIPGLIVAIVLHSLFNQFILPPLISTLVILISLGLIIIVMFHHSEKSTHDWLGVGLDTDMDLIESITSGEISQSKVGKYLNALIDKFPPLVVSDMLCLIRLHCELSVAAKGLLLANEVGVELPPDPTIKSNLKEMKYLEKNIGKTGLMVLQPILKMSSQQKWQRSYLDNLA